MFILHNLVYVLLYASTVLAAELRYHANFLTKANTISVILDDKITDIAFVRVMELDEDLYPTESSELFPHNEDLMSKEIFSSIYHMEYQVIPVSILSGAIFLQEGNAQLNLHIVVFLEDGSISVENDKYFVTRGTILTFYFVDGWHFCAKEATDESDCCNVEGYYLDIMLEVSKNEKSMYDSTHHAILWNDAPTMLFSHYLAFQGTMMALAKEESVAAVTLRSVQFDRVLLESVTTSSHRENNATNHTSGSSLYEPDIAGGWTTVIVLSVVGGIFLTGAITQVIVEYYCPKRAIDKNAIEFSDV